MKHTLFYLAAAAALLTAFSCRKNVSPEAVSDVPTESLTVNISVPEETRTKAAASSVQDQKINKVQVFVFDKDKLLETSYYKAVSTNEGSTTLTISSFSGPKTVYALVNHDRLNLVHHSTMASFEAQLTDLSMNTADNLVMSGKNEVTVTPNTHYGTAATAPTNVNIFVQRLACKILIDKITVNFAGTALEGATFTVKEIYLKNVVGKSKLGMKALCSAADCNVESMDLDNTEQTNYTANWYNKGKFETGCPTIAYESGMSIAATKVDGSASTPIERCLFAYPNITDSDSHADAFSQRHTRVVICANVKSAAGFPVYNHDSYYVFDLPILKNNFVYEITDIGISMLGKESDLTDEELLLGKVTPTITVDPWNSQNLSYEF